LAYINDIPGTVTSSEIKLFADDSFLFRTINNQHDSDLLQRDLTTLEDWENKWQMSFNQKMHYHQNSTEKQIVHAYSTVGLTIAVYAADLTGCVQSLRFRRKNPSILLHLPTMLSICVYPMTSCC
jgi:hypothetical protein